VLGHDRAPKQGYEALREACAPVIVVADRLPATVQVGEAHALDVHVVSDLRDAIDGAEVTARLSWPGGERTWTWQGDLPADSCRRVGTMQIVVPAAIGALVLELACRHAGGAAENRYDAAIIA
jgi:beta-mannosidase